MTWLHGYEVFPVSLGLTGILPDMFTDSTGIMWQKTEVTKIADNLQFSYLGRGGKIDAGGMVTEHGQNFVSPYKEKYPPEDANVGVPWLRQTSYYSEQKKRGLVK